MTEQKEAYPDMLKSALDEWDAELRHLETETGKLPAHERTRYLERIKALREKERAVKETLGKIFENKEDPWLDLKEGVDSAWSSLKGSLKEAKSEFEKGLKEGMEEKKHEKMHDQGDGSNSGG